nr:putative cytochrome P450 [Tanacetum cinerariifolium]
MRKICILELLSAKKVRSFQSIREIESWNLVKVLASDSSKTVNLTEKIFTLMNAITCRATVGSRCKDQEQLVQLIVESISLASGFDMSDLFPSIKILHIVTGMRNKLWRMRKRIDVIFDDVISDHQQRRAVGQNTEDNEDLLDVLLRLKDDGGLEIPLTLDNIKAIILDVFSAGTDTSAVTIEWTMSELMKNPRVMKKVQAEVRYKLQGMEKIHESDIKGLDYLKLVIMETLRFRRIDFEVLKILENSLEVLKVLKNNLESMKLQENWSFFGGSMREYLEGFFGGSIWRDFLAGFDMSTVAVEKRPHPWGENELKLNNRSYIPSNSEQNEPIQGDISETSNEPTQAIRNEFKELYASANEEIYPGCKDIDVYLRPLIDDLKNLWAKPGAETIDFVWWSGKVYKACPTRNKDTLSTHVLGKTAYVGHKRFLKKPYKWRRSLDFNGEIEDEDPSRKFDRDDIMAQLARLPTRVKAQSKVADILRNLKLIDPSGFFDIMIHLVIHLPLEALEGEPIHPRWIICLPGNDGEMYYDIIDVDEDDDIIDDKEVLLYDLADFDDEDVFNVDDDDGVAVVYSNVARGHSGDGGGDDRPPSLQLVGGCRGKGTRKPNLGGRKADRMHSRKETRNLGLRKITDELGPQLIRLEWKDNGTMLPLGDH